MVPQIKSESFQSDLGDVIFTSLIALGFDPVSLKIKDKASLNGQIFKKMTQKAGDHILYFLFNCINAHQATEVFHDCWPIFDKKTESEFRSAIFEWLKVLNQNEHMNLKPTPVISKAVVSPTSKKFLRTVSALTRFALHSQIICIDSSMPLLFLPTLANTRKQRQIAMKLILKSKLHHTSSYITAIGQRKALLQSHNDKAKELVERYRNLLKDHQHVQQELAKQLNESEFILPALKALLPSLPFDDFCQELAKLNKKKDEEVEALWVGPTQLQRVESESWVNLSPLLTGNKDFTEINGDDYSSFKQKTAVNKFYKEGKLDLLALSRSSALVLKVMASRVHTIQRPHEQEEKRIAATKHRSECVKSMHESTLQMRSALDALIGPLFISLSELRRQVGGAFEGINIPGSFSFCPPTPIVPLGVGSDQSKLECSNPGMNLRRSVVYDSNANDSLDVVPSSPLELNLRRSLQPLLLYTKQSQLQDCSSLTLKSVAASSDVSTLDSGCVLSRGHDSLMRSIGQLNITPRNRNLVTSQQKSSYYKGGSFSHNKSGCTFSDQEPDESASAEEKLLVNTPIPHRDRKRLLSLTDSTSVSFSNAGRTCPTINDPPSHTTPNVKSNCTHKRIAMDLSPGCLVDSPVIDLESTQLNHFTGKKVGTPMWKARNCVDLASMPRLSLSPYVDRMMDNLKHAQDLLDKSRNRGCDRLSFKFGIQSKDAFYPDKNFTHSSISTPTRATLGADVTSHSRINGEPLASFASGFSVTNSRLSDSSQASTVKENNDKTLLPVPYSVKEFNATVTSLESLLDTIDGSSSYNCKSSTLSKKPSCTTNNICGGVAEEVEEFVNSRTFLDEQASLDHRYAPQQEPPSKFLPEHSLFRTLRESIISGELQSDLLLDDEFDEELRRESLDVCRRDSVLSLTHRSSLLVELLSDS